MHAHPYMHLHRKLKITHLQTNVRNSTPAEKQERG